MTDFTPEEKLRIKERHEREQAEKLAREQIASRPELNRKQRRKLAAEQRKGK